MKEIKVVLFDIDDTLCKTAGTKYLVFDKLYDLNEKFKQISKEEFRSILNESRNEYFNKEIHKGFNTYARIEFWFNALKRMKIRLSISELRSIVLKYWEFTLERVEPYPDVHFVLDTLKKKKLCLATLTAGDFISKSEKLIKMKVDEFFDYTFSTEIVQRPKTSSEIYKYVIDYFGFEPSQFLMVGDKPTEDIAPANEVGITTVQVTIRGDLSVSKEGLTKPDFVAKELKDLLTIIDKI